MVNIGVPDTHHLARTVQALVVSEGVEPSRSCEHSDLNAACLPFHHETKVYFHQSLFSGFLMQSEQIA